MGAVTVPKQLGGGFPSDGIDLVNARRYSKLSGDDFKNILKNSLDDTRFLKPSTLRTASTVLTAIASAPVMKLTPVGWVGSALALGAGLGLEYMLGDARTLGAVSTSKASTVPKVPKNLGSQLVDNQTSTISEFKDNLPAPVSSSDSSLLGIIENGNINTVDAINIQTQIMSEQYGLINEHLGAGLLYQDLLIGKLDDIGDSLSAIASALQVMASLSIDSVATAPEPDFDMKSEFWQLSQTIANSSPKPELSEISEKMTKLEEYATVQKERAVYKQTPQNFKDLEGHDIKTASPDELKALSDANALKFHSDTNNQEADETDFPDISSFPIIPFSGRENVFNPNIGHETTNPFTHYDI